MKKISVILLALLVSTLLSFAQDAKFGLKGGLNLSKLGYSDDTEVDWRTGFHIGGLAHIHVTPAFSLQPEVYYSSQGGKIPFGNDKINLNLSYINIPLLLQYNFSNGFRLQGGPQLGVLVGVSDKLNGVQLNSVNTDDFNSIDISLPFGLSYLGYSGLGFDARYNLGLTNVNETSPPNIKNSVLQFGIFYLLDHKHKARSK